VIATLGDLLEDVVVWPSGPMRTGTDTPATIHRRRGGSAANVAAAVAHLGQPVRFIGSVGDDEIGTRLVAELAGRGVDVKAKRVKGASTGAIVVGVDPDGERSFFTDRGASTALERVKRSWLDGVTALHVPAYSFTVEPLASATIDAVWRVRAAGGEISIDTSSSGALRDMGTERFLELMADLEPDVVLANREEAALLGFDGAGCKGAGLTIVRSGSEPTVVVTESGKVEEIGVPPVEVVVDTTGAGDAFAAGWLVARAADAEVSEAVRRGHAVAARVLATPGAEIDGDGAG